MNNLLVIDLTAANCYTEKISEKAMDAFIGGRGLGAYLIYKYLAAGVSPVSAENVLIFSAGPLQGTKSYYTARKPSSFWPSSPTDSYNGCV